MAYQYRFRVASDGDIERLYGEVNEPAKMKRLGRTREMTREEFEADFEAKRGRLFACEMRMSTVSDWHPIGGVLLQDRKDGYLGIPWSLSAEFRGQGHGKRMVRLAVDTFPGKKKALIEHHNIVSIRCAQSAGYKILEVTDKYVVMIWENQ